MAQGTSSPAARKAVSAQSQKKGFHWGGGLQKSKKTQQKVDLRGQQKEATLRAPSTEITGGKMKIPHGSKITS